MTDQAKAEQPAEDLTETGYATRELAEAAYLSLNGYMFDMRRDGEARSGHPIGSWMFKDRDGELGDHVKAFKGGDAEVEPDRYLKEVNNVRKAMFRFLDIPRN